MSDKLQELGILPHEITPSVSIAVNGLLDHVAQLNSALQQSRNQLENLQAMVDVDPVSVIANRKALIKRLDWSIAMSKRYAGATSVVAFSINDADSISRTYGYQAAQRASNYTAEFIASNIRDTDFFARINENQFGAIMYFAEADAVKAKAEKLCSQIRQAPFRLNNNPINISLSYGVHSITAADDAENALLSAVNAMYVNDNKMKFEQINFKA